MWNIIPSLAPVVEVLAVTFTQPSAATASQFLLGWVMCLGRHTLRRAAESAHPADVPDHSRRHGLDSYYNFFERSAWTPRDLAWRVGVLVLTRLRFFGRITLLVDDTLAHKRGKCVWGLGWWRDAVASTKKRVATASGHNWVVLAVAYRPPLCNTPVLALPLLARLHLPGEGQASCPALAKEMLTAVLGWYPALEYVLVADGAYACKGLLLDLDGRVEFVGRMRGDATVYDPDVPERPKGKRGPEARKGPRLPKPRDAARQADRGRAGAGAWLWRALAVTIYGEARRLSVVSYEVVWPRVLGLRRIRVWVVRDEEGELDDVYLFTTRVGADGAWVVGQFAWRWAIEVLFRSSKQVLEIEGPCHWSRESVEKVSPWLWSMQSVVMVWYVSAGHELPEALEMRERLWEWDSEWSLAHMLRVLRSATLNATINPNSAEQPELLRMVKTLKNWALLAA